MRPPLLYRLTDCARIRRGTGSDSFGIHVPDLAIFRGDRLAITGPSGCGKSTLLEMLAMAAPPDPSGLFLFCREDGSRLDIHQLWRTGNDPVLTKTRRHDIGVVLQTGGLFPQLSARDNLMLARRLKGMPGEGRLSEIVNMLEIGHVLDRRPDELSVGQRQRVAIARAVMHTPLVVLADEPTAALDPRTAGRTMRLLCGLADVLVLTLVVVTHDRSIPDLYDFPELEIRPQTGAGDLSRSVLDRNTQDLRADDGPPDAGPPDAGPPPGTAPAE